MKHNAANNIQIYKPFTFNTFWLFLLALVFLTRKAAGADSLSCLDKCQLPIPKDTLDGCAITYTFDPQIKVYNVSYKGCLTLTCPTPTKKPTRPPYPTRKPTHKKTSNPTTIPPTPNPTEPKATRHPSKPPHPTPKPSRKIRHHDTKAPTACMPAQAVDKSSFNDASSLAVQQQNAAVTPTAYNYRSILYSPGMYQRGTGYISFSINGIENRCLAVLISNCTITFSAACMFNNLSVIPQEWYDSFEFHPGFDDTYKNLTAKYKLGFYPAAYQTMAGDWAGFNAAVVVVDPAVGNVIGWMNLTDSNTEAAVNQISFSAPTSSTAIIDPCCGTNNIPVNGAILFSQLKTSNPTVFEYPLIGISSGTNDPLVANDVISVLQEYAAENTGLSTPYSGASLPRIKDQALVCKVK